MLQSLRFSSGLLSARSSYVPFSEALTPLSDAESACPSCTRTSGGAPYRPLTPRVLFLWDFLSKTPMLSPARSCQCHRQREAALPARRALYNGFASDNARTAFPARYRPTPSSRTNLGIRQMSVRAGMPLFPRTKVRHKKTWTGPLATGTRRMASFTRIPDEFSPRS